MSHWRPWFSRAFENIWVEEMAFKMVVSSCKHLKHVYVKDCEPWSTWNPARDRRSADGKHIVWRILRALACFNTVQHTRLYVCTRGRACTIGKQLRGWDGIDSPRTLDKSSWNFANFLAQEAIDWRADRCLKTLKWSLLIRHLRSMCSRRHRANRLPFLPIQDFAGSIWFWVPKNLLWSLMM